MKAIRDNVSAWRALYLCPPSTHAREEAEAKGEPEAEPEAERETHSEAETKTKPETETETERETEARAEAMIRAGITRAHTHTHTQIMRSAQGHPQGNCLQRPLERWFVGVRSLTDSWLAGWLCGCSCLCRTAVLRLPLSTLQHTATHCNILPRTTSHCNTILLGIPFSPLPPPSPLVWSPAAVRAFLQRRFWELGGLGWVVWGVWWLGCRLLAVEVWLLGAVMHPDGTTAQNMAAPDARTQVQRRNARMRTMVSLVATLEVRAVLQCVALGCSVLQCVAVSVGCAC